MHLCIEDHYQRKSICPGYKFWNVQNINSNTSSGVGLTMFHLMGFDSFSPNSQQFPTGDGMSGFTIKQFLQANVCNPPLPEWRCKLSRQSGIECASNFPGPEEHSLYLKILTSLPLWPYTSQAKACTHSSCSSDTVGTSPNTANSCM